MPSALDGPPGASRGPTGQNKNPSMLPIEGFSCEKVGRKFPPSPVATSALSDRAAVHCLFFCIPTLFARSYILYHFDIE